MRLPLSHNREPDSRLSAEGIGVLYDAHAPAVLRFFIRRVLDPEVAFDLTAETFAQALVSRMKFRGTSQAELEAWVFGIARAELGRYIRRGRSERNAISRLGLEVPSLGGEDLERIEAVVDLEPIRGLVWEALTTLSPDQRGALELRVVDELPYPQVAERLEITEEAARARVSRGLRALGAALDGQLDLQEVSND